MKINSISTNKLQLIISFGFIQLLGLLIVLGSLFILGYLSIQYTIVCKEKQINLAQQCTLGSNVYSIYNSNTDLGSLTQAVVMSRQNSKGGLSYWVDLSTNKGLMHLTGGSSSGRSNKDTAAAAINNYISNSTETRFEIPYPSPWWAYALASLFLLVGILLIVGTRKTIIDFDKTSQSVVIHRKSLLSAREIKLKFSEIDKIIIEESRSRKGGISYRLALLLKDNSIIPFVTTYDSSYNKKEKIAQQINDFITPNQEPESAIPFD